LVALRSEPGPSPSDAFAATLPPDLRPVARGVVRRLTPGLHGGEIYTDDRAPVEWLIDRSIVDYAAQAR
jgi:hypothetical protein